MGNRFKGRSLAVINDLSIEERLYLFEQTRRLKQAMADGNETVVDNFRIADRSFGIYEVFLEDSTRTRESFKNAAKFHDIKVSALNTDSSSFNKGESYADTFNTLIGYDNTLFVIRSKLEGVCRWLETATAAYARRNNLAQAPAFINAGDGKHEHPTQELLDEFTFLEDNGWSTDSIHLALVGDLFHGRTVHSKANGLALFNRVKVDLVAPDELSMPEDYLSVMRDNGFEIRTFPSIEAYLSQPDTADKWYFTRPQLERMGERVLRRQDELRRSITFTPEFMDSVKPGTQFYHPLPRNKVHPVIPPFLDETPLNGWERQSANGMLVRIILLGLISGHIGDDFLPALEPSGSSKEEVFIEKVSCPEELSRADDKRYYSEGVRPIGEGVVIDHICRDESSGEIREHMHKIVSLLNLHGKGGEWVSTSRKDPASLKGIIFRPGHQGLSEPEVKRLAALAPGSTLNVIREGAVKEKFRLHLPPQIYNLPGLSCRNSACISHPDHNERVPAHFHRTAQGGLKCEFCGTRHTYKEIWKR